MCHLEGRIVEVILVRPLRPETVTGKTKGEAIATEVPCLCDFRKGVIVLFASRKGMCETEVGGGDVLARTRTNGREVRSTLLKQIQHFCYVSIYGKNF